eukprot:TRINITY_DN37_c0_g1_i3.p1 TRINITY_DN37_c0_g1~~TRINITY_DN37_c0_g1_i3.p1  ORF type:complete len:663 (-),score=188.25 TRINITY_DN37_c0_g1_i3:31-1944(-)
MANQVIVVGGGLAGLSAAHTVLENGGRVVLIDKNAFLGGNSTKATSGINGALTKTQRLKGIPDSPEIFEEDTILSAGDRVQPDLVRVLTHESGPAVEWLINKFGLDLSLISRLGGHSQPRTHRGKERFPGMTITYALMEKLEEISKAHPEKARVIVKARVVKLLTDASGAVVGVNYEFEGRTLSEHGPVILATGGYGADFTPNSLLAKYRPDLMSYPTTNGEHCTGDGIKLAQDVGAALVDMEYVQVHPTGLVHPDEPDAKVKFLAAEALRGVGGLLLDREGNRFCNELGRRDYVSGEMGKGKGPFRLVLNSAGAKEIEWHCKHYVGRGLMKHFKNGAEFAKELGIKPEALAATFAAYNEVAKKGIDQYGKKFFQNMPFDMNDNFHVAIVCPIVHYCMGGVRTLPDAAVASATAAIPGLFATGEICGGVHGKNRLGGNSLLDCVVFGRVSGASVCRYLLSNVANTRASKIAKHVAPQLGDNAARFAITISQGDVETRVEVAPESRSLNVDVSWNEQSGAPAPVVSVAPSAAAPAAAAPAAPAPAPAAAAPAAAAPAAASKVALTVEEVAKHNKESDCWVIVNGKVLDVTSFLKDHPGGKKAILLFAGKDASAEFNMLHKPDVVQKYAPQSILGDLQK